MLKYHDDKGLYREHREHIQAPDARVAFDYLVGRALSLARYDCEPGFHGVIRDFRYYDRASGEQPFALIVNSAHLLLYVRRAGLGRVPGGVAALREVLSSAKENRSGEWTVRVENVSDARKLCDFLFADVRRGD